jgi:hypothetical protein
MGASIPDWFKDVEQLSKQSDSPEIALLARAILSLARQTVRQRDNNLAAFDQIEELGRRTEPDEEG